MKQGNVTFESGTKDMATSQHASVDKAEFAGLHEMMNEATSGSIIAQMAGLTSFRFFNTFAQMYRLLVQGVTTGIRVDQVRGQDAEAS